MSYGRTRKQVKLDVEDTFNDIIKRGPSESAKRQMQHEAYHAYGRKKKAVTEYASVAEFYEARLKGGGAGGNDKGAVGIVQEQSTGNKRTGLDVE